MRPRYPATSRTKSDANGDTNATVAPLPTPCDGHGPTYLRNHGDQPRDIDAGAHTNADADTTKHQYHDFRPNTA
eukprot:SAG25_NODE_5005_length_716_cov_1.244733_1_plen_74_part_00